MTDSIFLGLIRNIAILFSFCILFDYFRASQKKLRWLISEPSAGILLSGITLLLILTPWSYDTGIFFDSRSILLCLSGLFFGTAPTIITIILTSIYRIYLGGEGAYMGVAVILSSGTIGILWNHFRPLWREKNTLIELTLVGFLTHFIMLACTLLLPPEIILMTFKKIALSVLTLYPVATITLGMVLLRQDKARQDRHTLIESEKRWQFAIDSSGEGIWDWNMMTNEVYFSSQWKQMLGYDDDEISNQRHEWENRVHPDDLARVYEDINQYISNQTHFYSSEYRMLCKNKSYKWILDRGKIIQRDKNGKPLRFIGTHNDISERKEYELLLSKERLLLDTLMNLAPECIFFKDKDSRFTRVNKATAEKLGYENPMDIIGKSDFDFYEFDLASKTYKEEQDIIKKGKIIQGEEHLYILKGAEAWRTTTKYPLHDTNNTIIGTFGMSIDITDYKKVENALRESERYTNSILKTIPDLIFILDSDGTFIDCRTGDESRLAFRREEFLTRNISELFPPELALKVKDVIKISLTEDREEIIEYDMEMKGETFFFECHLLPFGNKEVIAIAHDITTSKKIEQEITHSRNQLKKFAAHLQDIREEERVLQAKEIHDELGQILVALKIDIGMFKQSIFKNLKKASVNEVNSQFEKLYEQMNNLINTVRRIMNGLQPELIELAGFCEAAQIFVTDFEEKHLINCKFDCRVESVDLELQKSIALFRILQEALLNVAKHSKASTVNIYINVENRKLYLQIIDNGIGFDQNIIDSPESFGFIGMSEWAYLLDGKLTIRGNKGKGASINFEMPYTEKRK